GRNSGKHRSSSSSGTPHSPTPRSPGVSATYPPQRSGTSSAVTVVCRPFLTASLISAVLSPSPGSSAFSRLDLPTPLGPASALVRPHSTSRSSSSPRASTVLVYSTG